jgi:hypothetical protein
MRLDRRSTRLGKVFLLPLLVIVALLGPILAAVASAGVNVWTTMRRFRAERRNPNG